MTPTKDVLNFQILHWHRENGKCGDHDGEDCWRDRGDAVAQRLRAMPILIYDKASTRIEDISRGCAVAPIGVVETIPDFQRAPTSKGENISCFRQTVVIGNSGIVDRDSSLTDVDAHTNIATVAPTREEGTYGE